MMEVAMMEKGKSGSLSSSIYLQTRFTRVRCRCLSGHAFVADIYSVINIKTDQEALVELISIGNQIAGCTICASTCIVAEPITLHDPQNERFALFIPDAISHRELHFKADLLNQLADTETNIVPSYFEDFQTLVGVQALQMWHESTMIIDEEDAPPARLSIDLIHEKSEDKRQPTPIHLLDEKLLIRQAFADLASSDSQLSSIPDEAEEADDWSDSWDSSTKGPIRPELLPQYHLAGISDRSADDSATPVKTENQAMKDDDVDFVDLLTAEEKLSNDIDLENEENSELNGNGTSPKVTNKVSSSKLEKFGKPDRDTVNSDKGISEEKKD